MKTRNPAIYLPGGPCTLNGVTYNPCSSTSNINQRRKFTLERPQDGQYLGRVSEYEDGGTMSYHGMRLTLERRVTSGTTFSGNYTWSHCIGEVGATTDQGPSIGTRYPNLYDRHSDRGNCASSRRHIVNLTAVAESPKFSNRTARILATGWRLSGIYRWSTGSYLTVTDGIDRALNGVGSQRPNQAQDNVFGDKSAGPLAQHISPSAFTLPPAGTMNGNLGRANIIGPANWTFDTALSRVFQMSEKQRLEFRAEAYNLTNSFRPRDPGTALNTNTFGQIRTAFDPRILQFALKYVF